MAVARVLTSNKKLTPSWACCFAWCFNPKTGTPEEKDDKLKQHQNGIVPNLKGEKGDLNKPVCDTATSKTSKGNNKICNSYGL